MKALLRVAILLLPLADRLPAEPVITWKRQVLETGFYAEGATLGDINGDAKPDIVAGPFWWEGPAFERRHAYYEPRTYDINGYSDNFFAYVRDFNADGRNDILIVGFPGKEARLHLNPGQPASDAPWERHVVAEVVDGESPVFTDITGDGRPELVCGNGGRFGWFAPAWGRPGEKWPFVAVTEDVKVAKFTHGLGVGDVNGDGKLDLLEARRWWEHTDGGPWRQHNFAAGVPGGAQMFAWDFDGNGTRDIFTSLAAHRYGVAVFLQNRPAPGRPAWTRVLLASENPADNDYGVVFSQPHAAHLADINGDGLMDIVTGRRYWAHNGRDPGERGSRVIYWYETRRDGRGGVDFAPHLIDANTGVGVDVQVGDLNGDALPDIVVANKAGVFALFQERREAAAAEAEALRPRKLYGAALRPQAAYAHGQSPQAALAAMQLPGGFRAELVAAEPDLVQPIAFTFDERGRIWVIEGNSYPQPRATGAGRDRIKILEDGDGDGGFETVKVFAEGLNLASGIEVGFGGVWIGAAPYLMFIPDRDGDDRPDAVPAKHPVPGLGFPAEILLDGWGTQDTHETLNSFLWGPDGWLYGCHGVFTHSRVGKPGAPDEAREPINAGVWRYHPVRQVFEVFAHGTSNPWGLDYDPNGEFFATACVIPHLYHIVPGGRYQRQAGRHFNPHTYEDIRTIADHAHYAGDIRASAHWGGRDAGAVVQDDTNAAGGGHAHCGLAIYQSSLFPPTYRGALLFGNLHGHRLVMDTLEPRASTFVGKHGSDFLRSNDMNFIPVTQKVGPDGALYVSDWSDKQVCHRGSGAVELWDRSNGRIYRVSHAGWKPWKGDLSKESGESLAKLAVQRENEWESRMARRVLMERAAAGKRSAPVDRPADVGSPAQAGSLRGLWLISLSGPGVHLQAADFDPARDERVVAQRVRLAASDPDFADTDLSVLTQGAARHPSPVVRRELASALQRLPVDLRAMPARALLGRGEDRDDPFIPLLIWYGIEPVVAADPKAALELARVSRMPKVTEFIYRRMGVEEAGRTGLLALAAETKDAAQREALLRTVIESARAGNRIAMPGDWAAMKARLGAVEQVAEIEAFMGVAGARDAFRARLMDASLPRERREVALALLLGVRDAETAPLLVKLIRSDDTALLRRAIQGLATLPHPDSAALLVGKFPAFDAATQNDAVNTLATHAAGARALLAAVKARTVPATLLSPFLARQMDALRDPEVSALLKETFGDLNAPKPDLAQRKAKLRPLLRPAQLAEADKSKGRVVFGAVCGQCHRLFGEGQAVGPDLTGSNRMNLDYLLDNVLDPNAVIGKDYQLNLFELKDGRVASGVVKEETAAGFRIAMPGGLEQAIPASEVRKRTVSKLSTMPEGLFDVLPAEQLQQLVAYLQAASPGGGEAPGSGGTGFRVEGAIEGEAMKIAGKSAGSARSQKMGAFRLGRWSGAAQLFWTGAKPGDTLVLELPVAEEGRYQVRAAFTKARDYATVAVRLDGEAVSGSPLDLYNPDVVGTGEVNLGTRVLAPGVHRMEIQITGANAAAVKRHFFGLDYVRLAKP